MPRNTFFSFKYFTVRQENCAMKVCTDACVFGAWAELEGVRRLLDIGTGTGLLALMTAQRNPGMAVDAVEIEEEAFRQAVQNVGNSPFGNRISVYHTPVQLFSAAPYDSIVVNPPFFQKDLRSPDRAVTLAHHAVALDFKTLEETVSRLLDFSGSWHVLLPPEEAGVLQRYVHGGGWRPERELLLVHKPGLKPFRKMVTYRRLTAEQASLPTTAPVSETLFIYREDGRTYDPAFVSLLKAFYLAF